MWPRRYQAIREHERHLAAANTLILKFWLNVSRDEQKRRFLARIDDKRKNWKFSADDVKERARWDDYMHAYEATLRATSRPWAPWYAIPADDKPYMRARVAGIIIDALTSIGLDPQRLRLEWISAAEGSRYAEVMNDFSQTVKSLGPLGEGEGIDKNVLAFRMKTLQSMIPYIKLVERERLRVPHKSEDAYRDFFASDRVNQLFKELSVDKLAVSQIMLLLQEKPHSTAEISEILGLNPSEVSRHMNSSSRQGLIRYDVNSKCYARA